MGLFDEEVGMQVLGIDNVLVPVGDLSTAKEFYATKLGLGVKFEVPNAGLALFTIGDEAPGIMVRVDPQTGSGTAPAMRLWLEVSDARVAAQELTGRGVELLAEPFEVGTGWTVEVADP